MPRHRPLTVIAEEQIDSAAAVNRAQWEASVRYGRSRRGTYTVLGWFNGSGLWAPGQGRAGLGRLGGSRGDPVW